MSLRPTQLQRAAALDRARNALAARTPITANAVDAGDLLRVAQFILDGRDPWLPSSGVLVENDEQKGITE
jgi:hypothetical protein